MNTYSLGLLSPQGKKTVFDIVSDEENFVSKEFAIEEIKIEAENVLINDGKAHFLLSGRIVRAMPLSSFVWLPLTVTLVEKARFDKSMKMSSSIISSTHHERKISIDIPGTWELQSDVKGTDRRDIQYEKRRKEHTISSYAVVKEGGVLYFVNKAGEYIISYPEEVVTFLPIGTRVINFIETDDLSATADTLLGRTAPGMPGTSGTSGISEMGTSGSSGSSGTTFINHVGSGSSGTSGSSGFSGTSGITLTKYEGTSGSSGIDGERGTSIFTWQGTYDPEQHYLPEDVVKHNNSVWLCLEKSKGEQPSLSPLRWDMIMGSAGDLATNTIKVTLNSDQIRKLDTNLVILKPVPGKFIEIVRMTAHYFPGEGVTSSSLGVFMDDVLIGGWKDLFNKKEECIVKGFTLDNVCYSPKASLKMKCAVPVNTENAKLTIHFSFRFLSA